MEGVSSPDLTEELHGDYPGFGGVSSIVISPFLCLLDPVIKSPTAQQLLRADLGLHNRVEYLQDKLQITEIILTELSEFHCEELTDIELTKLQDEVHDVLP